MLVLTRKTGEELVIGDNIRITINKVAGNRVTVGVSAPDDVRIIRGELQAIVESFEDPTPIAPTAQPESFPFAEAP